MAKGNILGTRPEVDPFEETSGSSYSISRDTELNWDDRKERFELAQPLFLISICIAIGFFAPALLLSASILVLLRILLMPSIRKGFEKKSAKLLLLCSGKLFYELDEKRRELKRDDVAIVRIEQLYPYPQKQMDQIFAKYADAKVKWVQEEPLNMGAWQYLLSFWRNPSIEVIGRKTSASTATGYKKVHDEQQERIINEAFTI